MPTSEEKRGKQLKESQPGASELQRLGQSEDQQSMENPSLSWNTAEELPEELSVKGGLRFQAPICA